MDRGLYLLVEIEDIVVARACSKRGVVDILVLETKEQLRRSLHLELHTAGTKDLVCRTDVELHIRDVELLLVVMLHLADLLLPVPVHQLALSVLVVLVLREHIRRSDVRVAHARAYDIGTRLGLVLDGRGDVRRVLKIERRGRLRQLAVVLRTKLAHLRWRPDGAVGLGDIVGSGLECRVFTVRSRGSGARGRLLSFLRLFLCRLTCSLFCHKLLKRLLGIDRH